MTGFYVSNFKLEDSWRSAIHTHTHTHTHTQTHTHARMHTLTPTTIKNRTQQWRDILWLWSLSSQTLHTHTLCVDRFHTKSKRSAATGLASGRLVCGWAGRPRPVWRDCTNCMASLAPVHQVFHVGDTKWWENWQHQNRGVVVLFQCQMSTLFKCLLKTYEMPS